MNLIDKKVTHKRFGLGRVVDYNDTSIEVHFATENKLFVYPDAFENYLEILDEKISDSMDRIIEEKIEKRKEDQLTKEKEREVQQKKYELRLEHEKLMRNHKLHSESQIVFWCDEEEQSNVFADWKIFSGEIKSGVKKGQPNKPNRLHRNSCVLLTTIDPKTPEKNRRIIGLYMVSDNFIGKLCEDGMIPAHSKYKIQFTEEESAQLLFWNYYSNEKKPKDVQWKTGKYRYFNNLWMAQILNDVLALKQDSEEKTMLENFYYHFCKMNMINDKDLPKPTGALNYLEQTTQN